MSQMSMLARLCPAHMQPLNVAFSTDRFATRHSTGLHRFEPQLQGIAKLASLGIFWRQRGGSIQKQICELLLRGDGKHIPPLATLLLSRGRPTALQLDIGGKVMVGRKTATQISRKSKGSMAQVSQQAQLQEASARVLCHMISMMLHALLSALHQ